MDATKAVESLAALAQETRLEVFRLLVRAGSDGLAPGAIGGSLGVTGATLSFHLKELKNAGVVRCRRNGRSLIYSADFGAMSELVGFLTENCCEGAGACGPRPRQRKP